MSDLSPEHPQYSELVERIVTDIGSGRKHTHEIRLFPNRSDPKWELKSKLGAMGWQENYYTEADARAGATRWDNTFAKRADDA